MEPEQQSESSPNTLSETDETATEKQENNIGNNGEKNEDEISNFTTGVETLIEEENHEAMVIEKEEVQETEVVRILMEPEQQSESSPNTLSETGEKITETSMKFTRQDTYTVTHSEVSSTQLCRQNTYTVSKEKEMTTAEELKEEVKEEDEEEVKVEEEGVKPSSDDFIHNEPLYKEPEDALDQVEQQTTEVASPPVEDQYVTAEEVRLQKHRVMTEAAEEVEGGGQDRASREVEQLLADIRDPATGSLEDIANMLEGGSRVSPEFSAAAAMIDKVRVKQPRIV